jgi:hypothetical protein
MLDSGSAHRDDGVGELGKAAASMRLAYVVNIKYKQLTPNLRRMAIESQ